LATATANSRPDPIPMLTTVTVSGGSPSSRLTDRPSMVAAAKATTPTATTPTATS
jgi:hypothetical protein